MILTARKRKESTSLRKLLKCWCRATLLVYTSSKGAIFKPHNRCLTRSCLSLKQQNEITSSVQAKTDITPSSLIICQYFESGSTSLQSSCQLQMVRISNFSFIRPLGQLLNTYFGFKFRRFTTFCSAEKKIHMLQDLTDALSTYVRNVLTQNNWCLTGRSSCTLC